MAGRPASGRPRVKAHRGPAGCRPRPEHWCSPPRAAIQRKSAGLATLDRSRPLCNFGLTETRVAWETCKRRPGVYGRVHLAPQWQRKPPRRQQGTCLWLQGRAPRGRAGYRCQASNCAYEDPSSGLLDPLRWAWGSQPPAAPALCTPGRGCPHLSPGPAHTLAPSRREPCPVGGPPLHGHPGSRLWSPPAGCVGGLAGPSYVP